MKVLTGRVASRFARLLSALVMVVLISGCEVDGPVASYVWIDDFDLTVSAGQGSASERITEGWFYANGEFLGAYSLPHEVPVIAEGQTEIQVFPGIKVNGIISTPDIYPFYARYEVDLDLEPERTDTIRPSTEYLNSVKFAFIEDFETGNAFVDDIDGNTETSLEVISGPDVFEGQRSGYIQLTEENPIIEVANLPILQDIPTNNSPVFLEFNYKNNVQFGVGLVGIDPNLPPSRAVILVLNESEEWNKMYLGLTSSLRASDFPAYQIYITAAYEPGEETAEIFLDNFKLVQFDQ